MKIENLPEPAAVSQSDPSGNPPFTNILVPIDFSAHSRRALAYAVSLADRHGARLHLVYVIEPASAFSGLDQMPVVMPEEAVRSRCEQELSALAKSVASNKIAISDEVRTGRPAHEIATCAAESKADLIVISTHGRTGLTHILLGSVTESVVRKSPCPVLVIREPK